MPQHSQPNRRTTFTATSSRMNLTTIKKKTALRSLRRMADASDPLPDPADGLRASQLTAIAAAEIAWFYTKYDDEPSARLARSAIDGWLGALDPATRRTLSLRFDVSPWAEDLQAKGLKSGFALAVSLASATRWHEKSSPRSRAHGPVAEQLEAAVRERGIEAVRKIDREADRAFADAVRAYAQVRGRAPSVLPPRVARPTEAA